MKPKTIIRRNAEGKIIQVESIIESEDEGARDDGLLSDTYGKVFVGVMCVLAAIVIWLMVQVAYDVGYEYGQDHFLNMVNHHQVERGMPELSFETLYHQHRRFTFEKD